MKLPKNIIHPKGAELSVEDAQFNENLLLATDEMDAEINRSVLPRLKSDILDLFEGIATNTLSERDIQFYDKSAATVMLVSGGYPNKYEKCENERWVLQAPKVRTNQIGAELHTYI